jgi:prophage DNA circulation protein
MADPSALLLELSIGTAITQFGEIVTAGAADATAIYNTIYGLDDGNYYGRYFYGQNPLVTYVDAASSIAGLLAQGVAQQQAVAKALEVVAQSATNLPAFPAAAYALTEAVRTACANPGDAIRILSGLASSFGVELPALISLSDPNGQAAYLLGARATFLLRVSAAASLVKATADYVPSSQADAISLATACSVLLDSLFVAAADLFDDTTASAIENARIAVVTDLTARGANAANVELVTFQQNLPSSVVAYRQYGNATRSLEVLGRQGSNAIHPSFLPLTLELAIS